MKHDSGFWVIIGLYASMAVGLSINAYRFASGNPFSEARLEEEGLPRQAAVPEATRQFIHVVSDRETEHLELRVGQLVRSSTGIVFTVSLATFVFLGIRQNRLAKRLNALEAERRGDQLT